ncbi:MAG: sigma-70 family RNA polymerase sigma factor [Deltaproteobacteria bacterium]|nr:sigma-70 family RNA polymerase sigma factor [Deltaproteobacteria bacterium]
MSTETDEVARATTPDVVAVLVGNHRAFLAFLQRRVGDRALAEDLLQEAFARGIDKLDSLREGESAVAWFYRLLRNAVIDHYRRNASAQRGLAALATELEGQAEPGPELRDVVCRCVGELAGTLKAEYASAIRRIDVEGVAVKDYATEAGISRENAAVRVFRARDSLRKQVVRACGTCAEHGCLDCTCGMARTS